MTDYTYYIKCLGDVEMGGLFGVVTENNCKTDLFFGIDYHSHLGTTMGGLAVLSDRITEPTYHTLTNSQFKTEFKDDFDEIDGNIGIGVISSRKADKQPLVFKSKLGTFALCTDGLLKNADMLVAELVEDGVTFNECSEPVNQTEVVGSLICRGGSIADGIYEMSKKITGTLSLLLLSEDERCVYSSSGVFPLIIGKKLTAQGDEWAIASETSAFPNLGYEVHSFPRYMDVVSIAESGVELRKQSNASIVFCPFLHVYFDFPASSHYGVSGETVRERCGGYLAEGDDVEATLVMGVADSGIPHAHGYAKTRTENAIKGIMTHLNQFVLGRLDNDVLRAKLVERIKSIVPVRRPVVKYTAGWGRSYIPPQQSTRDVIAYYKQVANPGMISNQSIILVDDSIRRGTQLRRFIKEKLGRYKPLAVHARVASPPQLFACYFDDTTKDSDLIARKAVKGIEGGLPANLDEYLDVSSEKYGMMVDRINESIGATSLRYIPLSDMVNAVVASPENNCLKAENICTYCWTGKPPVLR
jgi:amidophosphoribosyltransferase